MLKTSLIVAMEEIHITINGYSKNLVDPLNGRGSSPNSKILARSKFNKLCTALAQQIRDGEQETTQATPPEDTVPLLTMFIIFDVDLAKTSLALRNYYINGYSNVNGRYATSIVIFRIFCRSELCLIGLLREA
jgi:hypothetical protein